MAVNRRALLIGSVGFVVRANEGRSSWASGSSGSAQETAIGSAPGHGRWCAGQASTPSLREAGGGAICGSTAGAGPGAGAPRDFSHLPVHDMNAHAAPSVSSRISTGHTL